MPSEKNTPLLRSLRACTEDERLFMAQLAEIDEKNLYRIASGRSEPKLGLAIRIADAVTTLHRDTKGRVPITTLRDMAATCRLKGHVLPVKE